MFLLISYLSKFFTILGAINWYSIIKGIKVYKSMPSQKLLNKGCIIILNGITCNRYELIEFLFYNCYDKIKDRVKKLLDNKTKYLQNIDIILKYNLDLSHYNMMMNNIVANFNYFERLDKEVKIVQENKENAGFVDALQMIIGLMVISIFSFIIGYLLFRMQ